LLKLTGGFEVPIKMIAGFDTSDTTDRAVAIPIGSFASTRAGRSSQ
jgi:hypothetical protein